MTARAGTAFVLSLAVTAFATAALAESAPDGLFHGARMGMTRADLLALPDLASAKPDCSHIILVGQPRDTRVAVCVFSDKGPSGANLQTTYLMSADPAGTERLINVAIRGAPADATSFLDRLKARFGTPSYIARRRTLGTDGQPQLATVWTIGGRQIMYRERCKPDVNFCVDYSDSPFARSVTQQLGDS